MTTSREAQSARDILVVLRRGWLWIAAAAIVCGLLALFLSVLQKPVYEAQATLYVTSGTEDTSQSAYQGSLASQQRVISYTKLVSSDAVVSQALAESGLDVSLADARSMLSSDTTTDTALLNVRARSTDRQLAQDLSNAVAKAMTSYVSTLETPSGGGLPLAKLTLVTPASSGENAVSPRTQRNVALAVGIGFLIGVLGVLCRARYNNRVGDESDLAAVSDAPVLATVPTDELLKKSGLIDFGTGATLAAEAYRKLRTNLSFTSVDKPFRRIVVTSALAAEGKTTTAINLAAALAETGKRVVLVDADLRRPQVGKRTGGMADVGFTNYLKGDAELTDLLQQSPIDGLWILASGPQPPNPAELLGSKKAGQGLQDLAAMFDYVIVDSPPLLPVTDAAVLSQWVDGVLLVARANNSRVPDVAASIEQLNAVQAELIGIVITDLPTRGGAYKYGYYYSSTMPQPTKSGIFKRSGGKHKDIGAVLEPAESR